ncbi:hypothetical protein ABZX72_01230 [Streptomyces cyaneofuscatus]|uniref:hypothetical protein n=1 Tax=Streptomyces cyaneofuscatus TaxID=66883 RepID=UPI0033B6AFD9
MRTPTSKKLGAIIAVFAFFFILVITGEIMADDGNPTQSVLFYLAVAVPGGLLVYWLATRGRR